VSTVQPQAMQPVVAAPAPLIVTPQAAFLSRFRWYHAILAVGVLAASGAGTAVFIKVS